MNKKNKKTRKKWYEDEDDEGEEEYEENLLDLIVERTFIETRASPILKNDIPHFATPHLNSDRNFLPISPNL